MARMPETLLLEDLIVRGETRPLAAALKRHGFRWDPETEEWRSGWSSAWTPANPDGHLAYESPDRAPDGPAAEAFARGLSGSEGIEIGYRAGF